MTVEKKSRKQEIMDAALACFIEHGIEATTIDMIRERSGASIGSMYHHFGNKESIAVALYVAALAEHHAYQQKLLNAAATAEQGVRAIAHAYVNWVSANPDKARFVLYGRSVLAKEGMAAELREQTRTHIESVVQWFQPHIEAGRIRKLPMELYGSLMTGAAHDYARLWLSGRAKTDIRAYRDIFADAAWAVMKPA